MCEASGAAAGQRRHDAGACAYFIQQASWLWGSSVERKLRASSLTLFHRERELEQTLQPVGARRLGRCCDVWNIFPLKCCLTCFSTTPAQAVVSHVFRWSRERSKSHQVSGACERLCVIPGRRQPERGQSAEACNARCKGWRWRGWSGPLSGGSGCRVSPQTTHRTDTATKENNSKLSAMDDKRKLVERSGDHLHVARCWANKVDAIIKDIFKNVLIKISFWCRLFEIYWKTVFS